MLIAEILFGSFAIALALVADFSQAKWLFFPAGISFFAAFGFYLNRKKP